MIPRRMAFLGMAVALLIGAGIGAAATYEDDEDTPAALEQPATTTTALPLDTTTTVAEVTTTTPAASTTVGPTTTTRPGATTTTRRGGTTGTTRPATTAPTTPAPACTTSQMAVAVTTDRETYGPGQQVRADSTLRNTSASPCTYSSFDFAATFLDPNGGTLIGFNRRGDATEPTLLGPGQAAEASVTWNRSTCPSTPCPAEHTGTVSVRVTWNFPGGPYVASRTFTLT